MRLQHTLLAAIGCLSIGGTSLATLLDGRVNKSGDTMTGNLTLTAGNFSVNTGKVGVGTTTPATALHLRAAGATELSLQSADAVGRRWTLQSSGGDGSALDGSFQVIDRTAGVARIFVLEDGKVGIGRAPSTYQFEVEGGASKTTAGVWSANSDRRIKEDIQTIGHALETLDRVRLVDFRYTDDYRAAHPTIAEKRYMNVIAQEFAEVFPDHVQGSGEKLPDGSEILQVDTYPLIIYSAAAVQELHAKLKQKDADIAELKARLEKLEALVLKETAQ